MKTIARIVAGLLAVSTLSACATNTHGEVDRLSSFCHRHIIEQLTDTDSAPITFSDREPVWSIDEHGDAYYQAAFMYRFDGAASMDFVDYECQIIDFTASQEYSPRRISIEYLDIRES